VRVAIIGYAGETQRVTWDPVKAHGRLHGQAGRAVARRRDGDDERRSRARARTGTRSRRFARRDRRDAAHYERYRLAVRPRRGREHPAVDGTVGGGARNRIRGANSVSLPTIRCSLWTASGSRARREIRSAWGSGAGPTQRLEPGRDCVDRDRQGAIGGGSIRHPGCKRGRPDHHKRGTPGRTTWNFHTEQGVQTDVANYPANYDAVTTAGVRCQLIQVVHTPPAPKTGSCRSTHSWTPTPHRQSRLPAAVRRAGVGRERSDDVFRVGTTRRSDRRV